MGTFRLGLLGVVLAVVFFEASGFLYDSYGSEPNSDQHGQHVGRRPTTCKCGWANKDGGRIVGGVPTKTNEYPWMVAVVKKINSRTNFPFCGGSIISPHFVITAAHCTYSLSKTPTDIMVYVGSHFINNGAIAGKTEVYNINRIHQHELYNPSTTVNDIALMQVDRPIRWSQEVGPICLPVANRARQGSWIKVSGWGRTWDGGRASDVLKKVGLKVVNTADCSRYYQPGMLHPASSSQFCTYKPDEDSCQGDSGGPLIMHNPDTNQYDLVGLVSYGKECASRNPAVNTNVHSFRPWIMSKLQSVQSRHCEQA